MPFIVIMLFTGMKMWTVTTLIMVHILVAMHIVILIIELYVWAQCNRSYSIWVTSTSWLKLRFKWLQWKIQKNLSQKKLDYVMSWKCSQEYDL
jgi:hypothetical protein